MTHENELSKDPLHGEIMRPIFGSTSVFGDRHIFCNRMVKLMNQHALQLEMNPPFSLEEDPEHLLSALSRSELLDIALELCISVDELVPLSVDHTLIREFIMDAEHRVSGMRMDGASADDAMKVKNMLQQDALVEICPKIIERSPTEQSLIAEHRRKLENRLAPGGYIEVRWQLSSCDTALRDVRFDTISFNEKGS